MMLNEDHNNNEPTDAQIREMQLAIASFLGASLLYEREADITEDGERGIIEVPPMLIPKDSEVRAQMMRVVRACVGLIRSEYEIPDDIIKSIRTDAAAWSDKRKEVTREAKAIANLLETIDDFKKGKESVDGNGDGDYDGPDDWMPDTPRFRNN